MENPLEQKVFIENNKGQFDKQAVDNEKVFYKTTLNGTDIYFTGKGILYSHNEKVKSQPDKADKKADPDRASIMNVRHFAEFQWKDANSSRQFVPEEEVSFYYCYSGGKGRTIIAHAYKKLLCRNLYPGIDVEYSFQDGTKSLQCSFILHPKANSESISLIYPGILSEEKNQSKNVIVNNNVGNFTLTGIATDKSSANINQQENEIKLNSKTLSGTALWITNPGFAGYDAMYDLCYDDSNNVYVYGGAGPYQLAKINNSGNLKWIYNVNFISSEGNEYYGDFVIDQSTGTSYLGEALDDINGPEIIKVNSSGIEVDTVIIGSNMLEIWRMDMNYCTHQIIIGGGGRTSTSQAAIMDTSMSGLNIVNVLGASYGKHDIAVLASDKGQASCYMATSVANILGDGEYDNVLLKCPVPALLPTAYMNYDKYALMEILSNNYVEPNTPFIGSYVANGINGIVATTNDVYMWDGGVLSEFDKNNGSFIKSKTFAILPRGPLNGEIVNTGGIDADPCGNIYIGNNDTIDILDTSFTVTNSILLPSYTDTVFDLHLSPNGQLYACGYGFVTSYSTPQGTPVISKTTSPACSGCNGTAYVSLSGCGTGEFTWSNGSTGSYVTNLCAGTYTVSARLNCSTVISDTVNIPPSSNPSVTIPGADVKNENCFSDSNGSAIAFASGGTPPYTYLWFPSNVSNDTITNLVSGTYTFIVTDIHGCASIDTVTITQPRILSVNASVSGAIQVGQNATLTATVSGGTLPYTYFWSDGGSTSTITISPGSTTTYTVTVTDKNGCTSIAIVTVDVLCGDVFVPDAFTPNNNLHNNILYVRGDCITNMTFMVFDRWGNKVFESNNLNNGWNGASNGLPMTVGTYVWYLKATLKDGSTIERKGNVSLVR